MDRASWGSWFDRLLARPFLCAALLFLIALALRLLAIGRYVTPDELIWVYRSILFREALLAREWAATLVAGHPGVTTNWLGTLAISLQLLLQPLDQSTYTWITRLAYLTPDNTIALKQLAHFLDGARVAVAVANSLGVVAVFGLARSLFNSGRIAFMAALLLAIDPFLAGLSGLFHVDGLLSTWSIISLLALALGAQMGAAQGSNQRSFLWLALAGGAAGLAVLSKSPALLLLPVSALALLSLVWRGTERTVAARMLRLCGAGIVWLVAFLATVWLFYPALWVVPAQVAGTLGGNAGRHIEEALRPTFFLGDVAFDHGPLFYPVALLWRLAPLIVGGLALLLVGTMRRNGRTTMIRAPLWLLLLWVVLFVAGITLAAKKFDRYLLPAIPALVVLAAVGLAGHNLISGKKRAPLIAILLFLQLLMLAVSMPYLLSAYNPLLGGPLTAQYVLPIGWGEGVSAAGRWLAGAPGAAGETALSGIAPSLAPFYPGETLFAETAGWQEADQVILTASTKQTDPALLAEAEAALEPAHTVRFGLLPQAWVFHNPDPRPDTPVIEEFPRPLSFSSQMMLLGEHADRQRDEVAYIARWRREGTEPRLMVRLRLVDDRGLPWQSLETELLNEVYFYPQDWEPDETPAKTYRLPLALGTPPGTYTLELSLVDEFSGSQLTISGGGTVHRAGKLFLDEPVPMANPDALAMKRFDNARWPNSGLDLLGVVPYAPRVAAGAVLPLELIWQKTGAMSSELELAILLDGQEIGVVPLLSFDESQWQTGDIVRQKYALGIPDNVSPGSYELALRPGTESGAAVKVGPLRVDTLDRLFALPEEIAIPLDFRFDRTIVLKGAGPASLAAAPGESVELSLVWQTDGPTAEPVSSFVHLLDETGAIVAQSDQWPGGLPSDIWSPGQVIIDRHVLVLPAAPDSGSYSLVAGLYTASDGQRLPVDGEADSLLADSRVLLPIVVDVGN